MMLKNTTTLCQIICETIGPWIGLNRSKTERLQEILNDHGPKNGFYISERRMEMVPYCKHIQKEGCYQINH